jgi:hypothetical protein
LLCQDYGTARVCFETIRAGKNEDHLVLVVVLSKTLKHYSKVVQTVKDLIIALEGLGNILRIPSNPVLLREALKLYMDENLLSPGLPRYIPCIFEKDLTGLSYFMIEGKLAGVSEDFKNLSVRDQICVTVLA